MKIAFKKNNFSILLQITLVIFLLIFLVLPIFFLLFNVRKNDLQYIFSDEGFYIAFANSTLYSLIGSIISVVLATVLAYLLNRIHIKNKNFLVIFLTLPMLIPTISIGLGVRTLFGVNGFLDILFGLKIDGIGFLDLIIGSVVFSFPVAFLLIYDALIYEDKSVYDAASTMGISRLRAFFGISIPYLKTTIIAAFFASFTLIFADYGLPMEVAGKIKTLPMYLYEQVLSMFQYGRGAVISLVLLFPAIVAFIFDIFNKDLNNNTPRKETIYPSKFFNIFGLFIIIFIGLLLISPAISFVVISFVNRFPSDLAFTFNNYTKAFSPYSSVSIVNFLLNSLLISFSVGIFGTIITYISGYFTIRVGGWFSKPLHLLSIASLAIPGLVLGIGYVFLFADSNGWFAGTFSILIVVNIFHYFSSPYLMAKNAFEKIDNNFENVADTLGISRISLFFKVIIPNTTETILRMFSYYFINSMVTISAVSFLCTYATQPLAVSITTYENQSIWEMESVISTIIFTINFSLKVVFEIFDKYITKTFKRRADKNMSLSRFQFIVLTYIEEHNKQALTQRKIADGATLSLGTTNKIINQFINDDLIIIHEDKTIELTDKGFKALEPYRVRKAIILAAGFGSRMIPVTIKTPKPLVKVNGVRIIDTLIDALLAKEITNITIVTGYKKEQFTQLLDKYPSLKFIENPIYNESNNISSILAAKNIIDRCYICEADLLICNQNIITKYQYCSNYLGAFVSETDDWCLYKKNNFINKVCVGGENCWHMFGISYWNEEDSKKLREDVVKVFNSRGGKTKYWDEVPLTIFKKDFQIEIRNCQKSDINEIDSFSELIIADSSYSNYNNDDYDIDGVIYKLRHNKERYDDCLSFLRENLVYSGYIIPNLLKYGIYNDFFETFFSLDANGKIVLFATRYYDSMQIVCERYNDNTIKSIVEIVEKNGIKRISGTFNILEDIYGKIKKGRFEKGRAVLLSNVFGEYRFGKFDYLKAKTSKDFFELAELICAKPDFNRNYSIKMLSEQFEERYKIGNGRNYFIKVNDRIISHAGTYAECDDLAVISGVATREGYEGQGYGTSIVTSLKNDLIKEGKRIILYFFSDRLLKFYETFGYDLVKEWAKLELPTN